ncbi:uncharacterized protein FTJAE_632 [Fusarium tjaetaba]|uniref:Uncharacterized protein n=1 Tax=Fusarium tjaetaba TaxID=1567544 RepID=A0A8H5W9J4_9HYPO|nr:uncharacterized protein FTJAE_632 [Fusarium tjaetaba]KAF5650208.1 hypothetical protein FTJAE_632 [Fusarium tjaetaba]
MIQRILAFGVQENGNLSTTVRLSVAFLQLRAVSLFFLPCPLNPVTYPYSSPCNHQPFPAYLISTTPNPLCVNHFTRSATHLAASEQLRLTFDSTSDPYRVLHPKDKDKSPSQSLSISVTNTKTHKPSHANIDRITPQETGFDNFGTQEHGLAEMSDTADYSIVHPETCDNIAYFDSNTVQSLHQAGNQIPSEADFISYANNVVADIVGPAIDLSFARGTTGSNEELNDHLSKLDKLHWYSNSFQCARALCPGDVLLFYMENEKRRDWWDNFATLITEPKLLPSIGAGFHERTEIFILAHAFQILLFAPIQRPQGARYNCTDSYPRRFPLGYPEPGPDDVKVCGKYSLDDLYRAILLMFFLIQQRPWKEDSYVYRTSEVWLGYTTVRCHYPWHESTNHSAVQVFAFQKLPREIQLLIIELATSPKVTPTVEAETGQQRLFRKIQCTSEDSLLALKLTSRGMYQLVKTANSVEAIPNWHGSHQSTPVLFRINLQTDILRIFRLSDKLPNFMDKNGLRAPLPVRRLLAIESDNHLSTRHGILELFYIYSVSCSPGLMLDELPALEEYSLILPAEKQSLRMDGLPRIRPQDNSEVIAHIGTKWQFNLYRYYSMESLDNEVPEGCPMGVPPNLCDNSHLDGTDPSDRPGSIPYIGKYGYERSHGIVGGLWAGFKYYQESKEAYFAPLSWTEVEPLVMGDYGENGTRALFHNHTPQFVSKVWIIRQGTAAPKGWIKVQDAGESNPTWRHDLLKTWNAVRYTLERIQGSVSFLCQPQWHCSPLDCLRPKSLLESFRDNAAVREWLTTLATLLTEPKLIPTYGPIRPWSVSAFEDEFCHELFVLAHAVQIMLFAPVYWHEDGSYKSTDPYARRFPLKFPPPNSNDEKAFGEYTLDDLYRALILQEFLFLQTWNKGVERRCNNLRRTIPPKADAPWLEYSIGRSEPPWVEDSRVSAADRSLIMRLPREIQLRIVELAIPQKVTPTLLNRPKGRRGYSRVHSTWEDSMLALKLSSRIMHKLAIAEQNVQGVVDERVAFRMNLDIDTLRVFDMNLPDFLTTNGPSALPVRKLLSISKISCEDCGTYCDPMWYRKSPVGEALDLEKLPKLDEFSLIFPSVSQDWSIEGLPRVRDQADISGAAHTGIKWQFNTGLYPVPRWEIYHDDHFNGSYKAHMHPDDPVPEEAIPYVGKWGYERGSEAVGGYWASFQYFEETRDVYFAPLSLKEVEPLVKGPYGGNAREAIYEDHTPRFVAKLRIIRQGTTPPTGWIKVELVHLEDPNWKRQLLNTWKSVWYTLNGRRSRDYDDLPEPCHYYLRQT